jgi:hypothetical protein
VLIDVVIMGEVEEIENVPLPTESVVVEEFPIG